MRVRKKVAWMFSFLMILSFVAGSTDRKVRAQELGTAVPANITGQSEMISGQQSMETLSVSVSEGADLLDTYGTYLKVDGTNVENGFVTVKQASTHRIGVLCQFGYSISRANINGSDVSSASQDEGWYYYDVAAASAYDIKLYAGGQTYTIAWENSGALGSDATVEHGRVEILSGQGITDMTQDPATGGLYAVDSGTLVTVKLIPDYGYQLKNTDLNGATVAAGSEVSTFTFEMPGTNLHLAALFEQAENQIDCTASDMVNNVVIANGGNAASSGNLRMTVEDNRSYSTDVASAVNGSAVTMVASVDLTLDQIVNKGNDDYWTSSITEFTNPIHVELQLDAAEPADGETYSIVRDHGGVLTELDTSYNAVTGTLSFDTNQFSTYTIVKKASANQIIDGAGGSWTEGSSEGLTIRGNGAFSKFTGVKVDGSFLDQNSYTVKEGSTIVTLKASYLNTLAAGNHTVGILWTDGSANTTFTINENTSNDDDDESESNVASDMVVLSETNERDDVPETGDHTPTALMYFLVILSGTGLILVYHLFRQSV